MPPSCDVAIVGGGPGGAAAALALRAKGARVVLLESSKKPVWKIGETLAPECRPALEALGILEVVGAGGHLPAHGIVSAWGADSLQTTDFIFRPHGSGWQLDRGLFEAQMLDHAAKAGAEVRMGATVALARRRGASWLLETDTGPVHCAFLVDASGRRPLVSRAMGIARVRLDRLVAVYAVTSPSSGADRDSRTLIEARPDGWWYTALMPSGRRTVCFLTDPDLLGGPAWRTSAWFRRKIGETRHLGALLTGHGYVLKGAPRLAPAQSDRLEQWCGEGWLALGDAAMSFDPLSGAGLHKALNGGERAAAAVLGAGASPLQAYARWCDALWASYLRMRREYYAMEQRWPDQPFWARRSGGTDQGHRTAGRVGPGGP